MQLNKEPKRYFYFTSAVEKSIEKHRKWTWCVEILIKMTQSKCKQAGKSDPCWQLLKCYQEDLSLALLWFSDARSLLYKGGVCCNWMCQLLLAGDKIRGTQGAAQVKLTDSISYDRKLHHPHPAPYFTTNAEINDASFAESCCLGCSGTTKFCINIGTTTSTQTGYNTYSERELMGKSVIYFSVTCSIFCILNILTSYYSTGASVKEIWD